MTDDNPTAQEPNGGFLSTASDAVEAIITGVPAPIKRSLFKVLGRLMTSAVEYPVAAMESAIEERKAESRARVRLINASASQIAEQLNVEQAYVHAASTKFAQRIVRERFNVDKIATLAAQELANLPAPPHGPAAPEADRPDVDEDWLNVFEGEAAQVSTEHAQKVFAKILAGEINRPASFSKKTLKLMGQLDNRAAQVFTRACSMSVSLRVVNTVFDARVVGLGQIGKNSLITYGLSYADCTLLQEYGLVESDLSGNSDYQAAQVVEGSDGPTWPMIHQNESWVLVKPEGQVRSQMRIEGMRFTSSGAELLSIVETHPVPEYTEALKTHFKTFGASMLNIVG